MGHGLLVPAVGMVVMKTCVDYISTVGGMSTTGRMITEEEQPEDENGGGGYRDTPAGVYIDVKSG